MPARRFLTRLFFGVVIVCLLFLLIARWITFHPPAMQQEPVHCKANAPMLAPKQRLRIYNQNVQYLAGKDYVFFYDLPDNAGPDLRPSRASIEKTTRGIAQLIAETDPDIIVLQEVDDGAARTDHQDQLDLLLRQLPATYACHTSALYWQSKFVPHPKIMGAVGTKLVIISKYNLQLARRWQLSLIPEHWLVQWFNFKRALLEARLPMSNGQTLSLLNTHLSAFSEGTSALRDQINDIDHRLKHIASPWILAGDFNLTPPNGNAKEDQSLSTLVQQYASIPTMADTHSEQKQQWFTYFPNDVQTQQPTQTIDYLFYSSDVKKHHAFVEQNKALSLSDHMPIIVDFQLP